MPIQSSSPLASNHHGSQVLSVVAPCTDNDLGLSGIDWYAQVFSVDSKSDASFSARMFGLMWAAGIDICRTSVISCPPEQRFFANLHKANIINASFGFAGNFLADPAYGPILDAIGQINRQGRIIVASAGNEANLTDRRLPGAAGGVISVGASTKDQKSAPFSNYGRTVDVLAPGQNIVGLKGGELISLNGTSFSAPIVSGVVSLMLSVNPLLSWKHAEYILKTTAKKMSCADYCPSELNDEQKACQSYCCQGENVTCASGIVDAEKAVAMAQKGIPDVALIDVDDYYLPLSTDNHLSHALQVKNWGKKKAIARLKLTDAKLSITPASFVLDPIDQQGVPGAKSVVVRYQEMPSSPTVISLVLEAANVDTPTVFHDQIEAIVEIVPDNAAQKPRVFKELLHVP